MCSIIGRPTTGSIGLGWLLVSGRSLVPCPPAMTTALMAGMIAAGVGCLPSSPDGRHHVHRVHDGRAVVENDGNPEHDPSDVEGGPVQEQAEVPPGDERDP